jgi:hypothetical protein
VICRTRPSGVPVRTRCRSASGCDRGRRAPGNQAQAAPESPASQPGCTGPARMP